MGRQIQLRIKGIDPPPNRMGIGGTIDLDASKTRHIGRALRLGALIFEGRPFFTQRGIGRLIARARQSHKGFQTVAAHLLKLAKHLLLDLVQLGSVYSTHNILLQLGNGGIQTFKQGFFFVNCAPDRTPLEG